MRQAVVMILAPGIILGAGSSRAYEKLGMSWKKDGPTFTICATGAPAGAASRIREAAQRWKYAKFNFKLVEGCVDGKGPNVKDGVNYVSFEVMTKGGSLDDTAAAYPKNEGDTDVMVECDIRFDPSRKWYTKVTGTPEADENDLASVALHEFGHCLGLHHSKVVGSVMEETLLRGKTRRTLTQDDLSGRNAIYGSP